MAAPNFIASASNIAASGTSVQVTIPDAGAGVAAGQRALLVLTLTPSTGPIPTAGWTLVGDTEATPTNGSGRLYVWTAEIGSVAEVNPGATVTVSYGGSSRAALAVLVYEASAVDASAFAFTSGSGEATITTPTASASDAARVVHIHGCRPASGGVQVTWTPDAATTERADACSNNGTSGNSTLCVADETIAAPGTTTARTATPTANVQRAAAVVVLSVAAVRPVANAGPDQNVLANATVNLDGSATDGGGAGAPYTWQWTQTSGTAVVLNDATAENPTFTAGAVSDVLTFSLVATDAGAVASLPDSVTITVQGPEDVAVPNADVDVVGWTTTGGAVWEVTSDSSDATYAISPDSPVSEAFRVGLSELNDAASEDQVVLSIRTRKVNASTATISAQLIEGASTVRATLGSTAITGTLWNQVDLIFTPSEITGVVSWADVDVEVTVTAAA